MRFAPTFMLAAPGRLLFALAVTLALASGNCSARSGMGEAIVSDKDGAPCFSVPREWSTRKGIPLHGVMVSDTEPPIPDVRPGYLWHVSIVPNGHSIVTHPGDCIRYGQVLPSSEQHTLTPLQAFHVYRVFLHARAEDSHLIGYNAEFCLVPGANGKLVVRSIPSGPQPERGRYRVCAAPAGETAPADARQGI